jgi:hypothetical protein
MACLLACLLAYWEAGAHIHHHFPPALRSTEEIRPAAIWQATTHPTYDTAPRSSDASAHGGSKARKFGITHMDSGTTSTGTWIFFSRGRVRGQSATAGWGTHRGKVISSRKPAGHENVHQDAALHQA